MNIKNLVITIIIVVALAGAGVLIYLSFFSGDKPAVALPATSTASTANPGAILPLGTKLDFDKVKEYNPSSRLFPYPTVQREETGLGLNEIISQ